MNDFKIYAEDLVSLTSDEAHKRIMEVPEGQQRYDITKELYPDRDHFEIIKTITGAEIKYLHDSKFLEFVQHHLDKE
jgi:hypothetical protein